jgi:hypothetical protein
MTIPLHPDKPTASEPPTHEITVTAVFPLSGGNVLDMIGPIGAIRDAYAPFVKAVHELGGSVGVEGPRVIASHAPAPVQHASGRKKAEIAAARHAASVAADVEKELAEAAE